MKINATALIIAGLLVLTGARLFNNSSLPYSATFRNLQPPVSHDTVNPAGLLILDNVQTAGEWNPMQPADAATFEKFRARGAFMLCLLPTSDEEAGIAWPDPTNRTPKSARSLFSGTLEAELSNWGWKEASFDQAEFCNFASDNDSKENRIGKALAALGINPYQSAIGGHNTCYSLEHFDDEMVDDDGDEVPPEDQVYFMNGEEYRCTGAFYRFVINHVDGAIFALNRMSPGQAAARNWDEKVKPEMLPKLKVSSDIMFAYWLKDNPDANGLRFFFSNHVNNDETMKLIVSILNDANTDKSKAATVPFWPGLTVGMDTAAGQALLGSPLGISLGYLLVQHKAELGLKTVQDVTIFRDDTKAEQLPFVQLVFRIIDVPAASNRKEERGVLHVHRFEPAKL